MIGVLGLEVAGEDLDLSFRRPPLSDRSGAPVLIGMGDPVAGPLLGLFYDAPSTAEQLAGPPDLTPAHSHPCDNFRVVMKGELWVGHERYHPGEFRLQRTGRPYGSDGDAPHVDGNWRIIFFADRRGFRVRPTNPRLRAESSSPEVIARTKEHFGDLLPIILPDEDNGVDGLVTTIDKPFSRLGHIDASFDESPSWMPVGDGARIAISLLGVHDVGPVVILQRTPAGSIATPPLAFDTDLFRCVIRGSSHREGHTSEMGDTALRGSGQAWPEVTAGPEGLDEILIIGDRRGVVPAAGQDGNTWTDTVTSTVEHLKIGLDALVDA